MLSTLYTGLFILSFIYLVMLLALFKNRISYYYIFLFACVLVTNFGYMQMTYAQDMRTAMVSNQTIYLGASFTAFFLLMCLADLCKVPIKKSFQFFSVIYGCFIFICVSTIEYVPWYYKNVTFIRQRGIGMLMKEYGPLHILYPLYMVIIAVFCVTIIGNSFFRRRDVSYFTSTLLTVCLLLVLIAYIVEKSRALPMPLVPIALAIAQAGVLILLGRISLYDISSISSDFMQESKTVGFIICRGNGKYLGGDEVAKNWFPELKSLHIDTVIKRDDTDFLQQMLKWIHGEDDRESVYIQRDDRVIEVRHSMLRVRKWHVIHCFYLRDDTRQQRYTQLIEQYNENLERDVTEKTQKIHQIQDDIIISMASIVENRDNNTGGHVARTSDVVKIFVRQLQKKQLFDNLTPEIAKCIIKAAPLHDFGKIAIPDVILNKPGKFTEEEYEEMKKHSGKGAVIVDRILQNAEDPVFKEIAVNVAHYHHERWDGKGYPEGIKKEQIPFEARIMALADVFDALVSKRVYKESFGYDKAFSIIEESGGTQFDPGLCREFLRCRPQLERLYDSYED